MFASVVVIQHDFYHVIVGKDMCIRRGAINNHIICIVRGSGQSREDCRDDGSHVANAVERSIIFAIVKGVEIHIQLIRFVSVNDGLRF